MQLNQIRIGFSQVFIGVMMWPATVVVPASVNDADSVFLSNRMASFSLQHQQQWGDFGFDTAASRVGGTGSPLRIAKTTYERGLGHHANGEIVVALRGQYTRFQCFVGVQWQGGHRGSVTFRVTVDGKTKFQTGPMSDSESARPVDIAISGARELRLIALDSGDGIGCDMANWAMARLTRDERIPYFGESMFQLNGNTSPPASAAAAGFCLIADGSGPQIAIMESARRATIALNRNEDVCWTIPSRGLQQSARLLIDVFLPESAKGSAEVELSCAGCNAVKTLLAGQTAVLAVDVEKAERAYIACAARKATTALRVGFGNPRYVFDDQEIPIPIALKTTAATIPPPVLPNLRPVLEQELVEWDWRMQDGIGTDRESRTWAQATGQTVDCGNRLINFLSAMHVSLDAVATQWRRLNERFKRLSDAASVEEREWESLWLEAHRLRRHIVLSNPIARTGPILFVKRVPSDFSHQLTQYSGLHARPGGGLFVLDAPGSSMQCRRLDSLPSGSYLRPDVSWDGQHILFSFCKINSKAKTESAEDGPFYHLFEIAADGSDCRQLTDGAVDDFSPIHLPDGGILFLSTRRGGFHRCGRGPCPVHTMAVLEPDSTAPRVISFHETHEWDPAVLEDGRVIYTRWDYVDRHAVHYQQLWSTRPDGTDVRIYYGNNTFNPVGVWEARPVPGSHCVMATAAAHHAMTAGSIILLDVTQGIDGLKPISRLTPDVLFPESEFAIQRWHATAGVPVAPEVPEAEKRWPGHCYRSPYPLSEDFFLAAYSFDSLIGEPNANRPNMFGLYLVDRFGNKELLYRDPSISSLWPMPLRPRRHLPIIPSMTRRDATGEGTFLLQDVHASWPRLSNADDVVKSLRIIQVLPKTTPNSNTPRVGLANASPGKQVLGTVPVEPDGSAYFRVPAGIPVAFQALDEQGRAIQTMRSLTYLQPGEQQSCVGCHEHRTSAPAVRRPTLAEQREPSSIAPGPDGSKPFNYAILVQPVLNRHCIRCHNAKQKASGVDLTGTPTAEFTRSYDSLVRLVSFSEWKGTPQANHEPTTHPGQFGARASRLMQFLDHRHYDVTLTPEERRRLITWMDTNALFYGTFDPADQLRQQRGERIAGPALE